MKEKSIGNKGRKEKKRKRGKKTLGRRKGKHKKWKKIKLKKKTGRGDRRGIGSNEKKKD